MRNQIRNTLPDFTVCGRTVRSSHRKFSIKELFLKSSQYPQETPELESLFKNVACLKAPIQMFFAKFLTLLISKNICEQLLFDFFDDSLLHGPKSSRS